MADQNHARNEVGRDGGKVGRGRKLKSLNGGAQRTEHGRICEREENRRMEKPDSRSVVRPPSPPSLTFEASMYRGIRSRLMPLALDAIWEQSTERHAANQTGRVLAGLTSDLPAHHSPPLAHAALSVIYRVLSNPFDRTNLGAGTSPFSSRTLRTLSTILRRRSLRTAIRRTAASPGAPLRTRAATVNWIDRFQIGGRSNRHRKIGEITSRVVQRRAFSGDRWSRRHRNDDEVEPDNREGNAFGGDGASRRNR